MHAPLTAPASWPARRAQLPAFSSRNPEASALVPLAVNKALVIELPRDFKNVLIANPLIVNAVVISTRRAYVIAMGIGQTNVYFFDDDDRQIFGLDIYVTNNTQPPPAATSTEMHNIVAVYRGSNGSVLSYNCSPNNCIIPSEALPTLPPGYSDLTTHAK